jgi:putative ABC transport system permease protein
MRPGSRSLLRTAPWTRAPTLAFREPAVALVIGGVAFVIGLVAASGPLFDASTGSAAFALEMSQQCGTDLGPVANGYGPLDKLTQTNATLSALSSRLLRMSGAPADSLEPPVVTLNAPITVGRTPRASAPAQLVAHPGGLAQIERVAGGGPGVWISTDLAAEVHVRPGGHLFVDGVQDVHGSGKAPAEVRVAGTYRSLVGTVLPPFWCSLKGIFGSPDENAPPPPVILTTSPMFTRIVRDADVHALISYRWEQRPSSGVDLEHAANTATAIAGFRHSVGTAVSRSGVPGHRIPDGYRLVDEDPDQYGFLVTHAQAVQRAVSQGIEPEIVAGVVVGLLLLGSASVFWAYRRRTEVTLLLSRGAAPGSIGAKAGLEAVPLMGIGAALGWIGCVGLLAFVGPSSAFGSSAPVRGAVFAVAAEAMALVLLVAMVALMTTRERRASRLPVAKLSKVPFELIGIGLSLWLWLSLQNVSLEAGGTSAPAVQSGFLIMPLLLLLSVSILFARLASIGLRRARRLTRRRGLPVACWLAVRRLAAAPSLGMLMVGSVALAVGAFTYAGAIARSQEYTLSAKAQTLVGSNTAVTVPHLVRLPPSLAANATEVLAETSGTVGSAPVIVIGVNPSSFEKGAFWDSSYSGQSLGQLMQRLAAAPAFGRPIPVIAGGPDGFSLRPGVLLPYSTPAVARQMRVVGAASTVPGQNGSDPILIMKRSELARLDPAAFDEIWSKDAATNVTAALRSAGIGFTSVQSATTVLGQIQFAPLHWTFEGLGALGVLVGLLAFAGLFLFLTARSRARALSYALGLKMGLSRRAHLASLGIEIGMLFGAALVIGMATAWLATVLVNGVLNPFPDVPPGSLTVVPWVDIAITLIVATLVWVSSALWAQHVTERRSVAGMLRYDVD